MANETKKRLLLSKWETRVEGLLEKIDKHEEEIAERDWQIEDLTAVLVDVKYWMHEPLVLNMPMRDPRVVLRKVEDALS